MLLELCVEVKETESVETSFNLMKEENQEAHTAPSSPPTTGRWCLFTHTSPSWTWFDFVHINVLTDVTWILRIF